MLYLPPLVKGVTVVLLAAYLTAAGAVNALQTNIKNHQVTEAAKLYIARRNRTANPEGRFDRAGRWYPSEREEQECCKSIRYPSRNYPYSLLTHCRTAQHVANLYHVDVKEVRRIARELEAGR